MWDWVKRLGGGFLWKPSPEQMYPSGSSLQLSNRIYFWLLNTLDFSFFPLAAHVKKNRHKYQEDGIPSPAIKARKIRREGTGELQPRSQSQLSRGHVHGDSIPWSMTRQIQWRGSSFAWLRRAPCTAMVDVDWAGSEGGSCFSDYYTAIKIAPPM